jgi:hypothetical protein
MGNWSGIPIRLRGEEPENLDDVNIKRGMSIVILAGIPIRGRGEGVVFCVMTRSVDPHSEMEIDTFFCAGFPTVRQVGRLSTITCERRSRKG